MIGSAFRPHPNQLDHGEHNARMPTTLFGCPIAL
jgi:hypothetical protein